MKKIIAISVLSLAFTPSFAQEVNNTMIDKLNTFINKLAETRSADEKEPIKMMVEPAKEKIENIKPEIIKEEIKTIENKAEETKTTENKVEETKTTENKVEETTKVKSQEKVKTIKHTLNKKSVNKLDKEIIFNGNAVLVDSGYYSIPQNTTDEDIVKLQQKLTYNDIDVNFSKNKSENISVSFLDKRISKELDKNNLIGNLNYLAINTDLSNVISVKKSPSDSYDFEINTDNKCQAIFLNYQLKSEKKEKIIVKYIDENGKLSNSLSEKCLVNVEKINESSFYTGSKVIINIGYNQSFLNKQKLGMTIHFTKEGKEITPPELNVIAISKNFSHFYEVNPNEQKNAFYGTTFNKDVISGDYYILVGFNVEKHEWIKSSTSVK